MSTTFANGTIHPFFGSLYGSLGIFRVVKDADDNEYVLAESGHPLVWKVLNQISTCHTIPHVSLTRWTGPSAKNGCWEKEWEITKTIVVRSPRD